MSQGKGHVPWGLSLAGSPGSYVIDNDVPYQSLTVLKPYLGYETLAMLVQEARSGTPVSTPVERGYCGVRPAPYQ